MNDINSWLTEKTYIPELLTLAPEVRPVLDRYGLKGCGGPTGPMETLEFFSKAHEVPLESMMSELHEALRAKDAPAEIVKASTPPPAPDIADTIYKPFFKSGIAVVLTAGAVWGAYLLLRIAFLHNFTAVGIHEVNAHGHAQIFGWVGLFVMGFAYQAFPRFKHASLAHPRLALASLWMMLIGIVGRSVLEPMTPAANWINQTAVASSVLEIAAIALFAFIIVKTLASSGKKLAFYDYYILSAIFWFVVQAVYETVYYAATLQAASPQALLNLVATYQGPMREIQIHGFAMLMILGVSQRIFHHFYGFRTPNPVFSKWMLVLLNISIIAEVIGFILMRTAGHSWAILWYGSILILAGATVALVRDWRIFGHHEESDRSLKFLRAGYVWLFISLAMLVLLPVYQFGLLPLVSPQSHAAAIGFSHAYYGAIRHAITVGFISLMIMGVAAKVVPTLSGVDIRALSRLWLPFVLINTGCFMRVFFQTLTDFTTLAFPVAGVSGILEVTALSVWGVHLWRIMDGRARVKQSAPATTRTPALRLADAPILATDLVADVLDRHPHLLDTFARHGFKQLRNPILRNTLARQVSIEGACRRLGVDLTALLEALNQDRNRTSESTPPAAGLNERIIEA